MMIIALLIVLIFLRFPVAITMGIAALGALFLFSVPLSPLWLPKRMMEGVASFPLLAIPFFVLAAEVMNASGITDRIYDFVRVIFGHLRGGLAHVNIVGSVVFSGMSGSAVSDVAGLGKIEIKAMKEHGYDPAFSASLTAVSATIGPIIPPSIPFVLFATVAEVSTGRLLVAGIVPGLIAAFGMSLVVMHLARRENFPREPKAAFSEITHYGRRAFLSLLAPVFLIGGIMSGWSTPTEAAMVACAYTVFLSIAVHREMTLEGLWRVLVHSGVESGKILILIAMAYPFAVVLTTLQVPQDVVHLSATFINGGLGFLFMSAIVLLIIGLFMEPLTALIIVVPLMMVSVAAFGIDPIHFGVVVVFTLMIGLITPPFGISMFIAAEIAKVSMGQFVRAAMPFYMILLAVLLLLILFPSLSTGLPNFIFGPARAV